MLFSAYIGGIATAIGVESMNRVSAWVMAMVCCSVFSARAADDPRQAEFVALFKQCTEGDAQACLVVGHRFKAGDGAPQNLAGAGRSYKRACELGLARACELAAALGGAFAAPSAPGQADKSKPLPGAGRTLQRERWYWAKYRHTDLMDAVLNGDAKAREVPEFKAVYHYYQGHYFANCPQGVPPDSPRRVYQTTREERSCTSTVVSSQEVLVRAAYFKKFQEYGTDIGKAAQNASLSAGTLKDMVRTAGATATYILDVKRDLDVLFTDNDCDSGLQQQFSENLRRIAYGEPTLQQDGQTYVNYAERDTSVGNAKKSLTTACYEHYQAAREKRGWGGDFWHENGKWCRCLDQKLTPLLSPPEWAAAMGNFKDFELSVTQVPRTAADPAWTRVSAANACKNP